MMKKRSVLTGFYVRDWGEGMSKDTIAKAYESYGEDTAWGGRNAVIGVGGKDALYGMEQCYIVSVKDHAVAYTSIRTTKGQDSGMYRSSRGKSTNTGYD